MSKLLSVLAAAALVVFACASACAWAKRPAGDWAYYHFDGRAFVTGQPADASPFVALRPGVRPVIVTHPGKLEAVQLPSGSGALAGICYVQSSGGKMNGHAGYLPSAGASVMIRAGDRVVATVKTDDNGYFVATLPAGTYTVAVRDAIETTVGNGTTTLVPIRAGKRMVD